ncbi:MAG: hypothetical protein HUN04_22290 [Desulfobacter sp.]|nr:MAG: hypothetical protein HUN04_22290 [Desulfobacter sp.]
MTVTVDRGQTTVNVESIQAQGQTQNAKAIAMENLDKQRQDSKVSDGMNVKESKGAIAQNQERQSKIKANKASALHAQIVSAIEGANLEATTELIEETKKRFFCNSKMEIRPKSIYKTISDFLNSFSHNKAKPKPVQTLEQRVENRTQEKEMAFEEMIYFSRCGDHDGYLKARKAWAAL